MIYKFKSKATGDLIMLESVARQILMLIGKKTEAGIASKGILLPQDIPEALTILKAAVLAEKNNTKLNIEESQEGIHYEWGNSKVSLQQRAIPFQRMLEQSLNENVPVVWNI